ncbi:S1C family serine protease [Demequina lignilytica]|uniref:Trypsin-like peptidase domain-containing protein n=1 Tax=Demequina lignilytica TaxID=3051663 RepID=A0AB35MGV5_9MICO|nr:trypsin-like peptidase domain-containing protein [Demequina sp. SYSU T0a273]MDN4482955.1 trypsin-like peptidase domain-containing protein [Demequina sp. SYSU T0a273]
MNDSPFAPPRGTNGSGEESATPAETPRDGLEKTVELDQEARAQASAPPTNATVELPSSPSYPPAEPAMAAPAAPAAAATPAPAPHRPDFSAWSTPAAPTSDPFLPPTEPPAGSAQAAAAPQPGRLRRSTVALIAAGALVLGGAAGFGGAWAYQETLGGAAATTTSAGTASTLPTSSSSTISSTDENTVAAIAAAVMPSVVSIEMLENGQVASEGSGFVIREDGYILTNNHVVADAASGATVNVVMSDGTEHTATVVGSTADYDLAVIKIDLTGLTPLVLGDSDALVVGDDVIAVGSPLGLESTVTTGIVSALHRPVTAGDTSSSAYIDAIQTDAAINPGNSGGPLINSAGEVIGINSAIASLSSSSTEQAGSVGLGFAIPSNQARRTAEEIIATGEATYPVIGVQLDSRYTGEGVMVVDAADSANAVVAGGPADVAGIEPGDIITAIDGRVVTRGDELVVAIRAKAPGDTVVLTVERDGSTQDIAVTLTANTQVSYGDDDSSGSSDSSEDSGGSLPDPSE